jgi:uncharacterized protein (TIGR02246 family)
VTVPAATATSTSTTTSTLRMDAEEAEIRRLVADAQKHQFDVVELMKLHHDDVVITNMAGRRVFGKQAFTEAMTRAMASSLQHVPTETAIDRLHFLSSDAAIVFCTKTVHDQRAASEKAPLPASVGMMSYVVVRKDDGWVIAAAQTTPVAG